MAKKQALGKGLSALLPGSASFEQLGAQERVQEILLTEIRPNPQQPRKRFDPDSLAELAESIKTFGVMQPLIVLRAEEEGYLLAAGERRFRAAQLLGLDSVPCIVRRLDQRQLSELSLLENIQREDLTPLEEAAAYRALMDSHGYTQEDLSQRLGKSRPHIANTLRLLQLAQQERILLEQGKISAGHARALLALPDARSRAALASAILKDGLSVRQAEEWVARHKQQRAHSAQRSVKELVHQDLARQISERLGLSARLLGRGEKGRLVIEYANEEELQAIVEALLPE